MSESQITSSASVCAILFTVHAASLIKVNKLFIYCFFFEECNLAEGFPWEQKPNAAFDSLTRRLAAKQKRLPNDADRSVWGEAKPQVSSI